MIVYDIEIKRAVPSESRPREEGVDYCDGWRDFENMGIACICAYDAITDRYRVFSDGNLDAFEDLCRGRLVAGFNSIQFDDQVLAVEGISVKTDYDLLREVWVADGLEPTFRSVETHGGYGLDALAKANGLTGKTGNGADAPIWWQRGEYGKVIDYCVEDVRQTWLLVKQVLKDGHLAHPKKPESHRLFVNRIDLVPFFIPGG